MKGNMRKKKTILKRSILTLIAVVCVVLLVVARQAGDVGIVQTSNGYHVMYFVSTNENPYWYDQAETSLKSSAYNEWYSAITDGVEAEQLSGMKYVG